MGVVRHHLLSAAVAIAVDVPVVAVGGAASAATPPRPSSVHVTDNRTGTYLTWSASGASRFQIEQATNRSFSAGRRVYSLRDGRDRQFTPTGLTRGSTYFWRVRAFAGSTASPWSATVSAAPVTQALRLRVEQFNVSNEDGQRDPGGVVLPWSKRRTAVAGLIKQAHPDVAAVEEAAEWANQPMGPRVADDIVSLLGAPYVLAHTEVPPGQPGWFRTGDYLIYDASRYDAAADGGHWSLGSAVWGVYQLLRSRSTGATFLAVGAHITSASGSSGDAARRTQTQTLIRDAKSYAAAHGQVPIVYAGDFNSHDGPNHAYDGPGVATRAALINDSATASQSRTNAKYNSANDYYRTPPAHSRYIDRIFAPAGVGVTAWRQWLNLSHGNFAGVIPSDHNPISADVSLPY